MWHRTDVNVRVVLRIAAAGQRLMGGWSRCLLGLGLLVLATGTLSAKDAVTVGVEGRVVAGEVVVVFVVVGRAGIKR